MATQGSEMGTRDAPHDVRVGVDGERDALRYAARQQDDPLEVQQAHCHPRLDMLRVSVERKDKTERAHRDNPRPECIAHWGHSL